MNFIKIAVISAAATAFIAACGQSGPPANTAVNRSNVATPAVSQSSPAASEAATGKDLYVTHCMLCHKDNGTGGKVSIVGKTLNPEDLTKDKFKNASDDKLAAYITDGVEDEGMPAFKDRLTPDQVNAVVKHVRTLQQ